MHKAISTRPWQCDIEINDAWAQGQIVLQLTGSFGGYIILPAVACFSWCHCQVAGLIDSSRNRGNGHLLVSRSRLPGENGLDNPPVCLPCIYLFIHAYSFVLRVTQAYNTQSFNTLKIVSVEILANYFPAGIQSWLFCLWQNIWSDFYCQIGCKQSSLSSFKVAQYAFKSSRPPNLLLSVCDQWWCVICQLSWEL